MMIWITLFDVLVDDTKVPRKIYFDNLMGFRRAIQRQQLRISRKRLN
ncbi:hypothetical protein Gotur_021511, partial [Gossypium turneri]